jgi:hypothetical protein
MTSVLRHLFWVLAGAIILLAPAIWQGRPFVFYDTPAYWGWGRDIFEALLRPWPHAGQPWIPGRALHGWEIGAHGATPGDLRFTLTLLPARSAFYALPFYLLTRAGGMWLIAGLQAAAAAWTVRVVSRALAPAITGVVYLGLIAALALLTSLGFEAGYAMPDLFGGLALLAAGAMIACAERLSGRERLGLCTLMAFAALVHAENILNLAAAAAFCAVVYFRDGRAGLIARAGPIAASLVAALVLAAGGGLVLDGAFGRPLSMAPFAASRVLADGGAQRYLRQVCPRTPLAACDLAQVTADYPEYYLGLYPLETPPALDHAASLYDQLQYRAVTDAEAAHRERFVAEQPRLVAGALKADGPHEVAAMLANGAAAFFNFGVNRDFDSLAGLLREHTQRRDQTIAITPGAAGCGRAQTRACAELDLGPLGRAQDLAVWASFAVLALGLVRDAQMRELKAFAAAMVFLVLANALLCGALSGAYDRYQARVEWLIPFCAMIEGLTWALRRRATDKIAGPSATFPSPIAPTLGATAAVRRS